MTSGRVVRSKSGVGNRVMKFCMKNEDLTRDARVMRYWGQEVRHESGINVRFLMTQFMNEAVYSSRVI